MLKKAALDFAQVLSDLRFREIQLQSAATITLSRAQLDGLKADLAASLTGVRRACILGNLIDEIGPELTRLESVIPHRPVHSLGQSCEHLRLSIQDSLANEWYFQVDRTDVQFYGKEGLIFGPGVNSKFKKAAVDLENAGNCLALQQPDACVFHLMRAMEVAVQSLGRKLKVTIRPDSTWRKITGEMDDKIKKMPEKTNAQKLRKNAWEEARANLHQVGSVWRNNTMHPAISYTRGQARDIFEAVRVFMNALARL